MSLDQMTNNNHPTWSSRSYKALAQRFGWAQSLDWHEEQICDYTDGFQETKRELMLDFYTYVIDWLWFRDKVCQLNQKNTTP